MKASKCVTILVMLAVGFSPCFAYEQTISLLKPIKQELISVKLEKMNNEFQKCLRNIRDKYLKEFSRKGIAEREAKKYFYQNKDYSKKSFEHFMDNFLDTIYSPLKSQFKTALHKGNITFEESTGSIVLKSAISGALTGGVVYYAATAFLAAQTAWWAGIPLLSSALAYLGYVTVSGPPGWIIAAAVALGSGIYLLYALVRGPTESDIAQIIENALAGQEKEWERFKTHAEDSFAQIAEQAARTEVENEFVNKAKANIVLFPTFARIFISYGNEMKNLQAEYSQTFDFDGISEAYYKYSSSIKLKDLQKVADSLKKWQKASPSNIHWLEEISN